VKAPVTPVTVAYRCSSRDERVVSPGGNPKGAHTRVGGGEAPRSAKTRKSAGNASRENPFGGEIAARVCCTAPSAPLNAYGGKIGAPIRREPKELNALCERCGVGVSVIARTKEISCVVLTPAVSTLAGRPKRENQRD
jgi:hypothetical protein